MREEEEEEEEGRKKRNRQALSCGECKRRKVSLSLSLAVGLEELMRVVRSSAIGKVSRMVLARWEWRELTHNCSSLCCLHCERNARRMQLGRSQD